MLAFRRWLALYGAVLGAALAPTGCMYGGIRMEAIRPTTDSIVVSTPVKASLVGGETVVYPQGAYLVRDTLRGPGTRHSLTLDRTALAAPIPMDSVISVVAFRTDSNAGVGATAVVVVVGLVAIVAILAATVDDWFDWGDWGGECWFACP